MLLHLRRDAADLQGNALSLVERGGGLAVLDAVDVVFIQPGGHLVVGLHADFPHLLVGGYLCADGGVEVADLSVCGREDDKGGTPSVAALQLLRLHGHLLLDELAAQHIQHRVVPQVLDGQ